MSLNPICACGCGFEVRLPWNKYIHGHFGRRLSIEQIYEIKRLLGKGVSQYKIAAQFDVSQACVCFWSEWPVPEKPRPIEVLRQEDLDRQRKNREEINQWQSGKRTLKKLKRILRSPQNLREAVSQQAQTSQT